MTSYNIPACQVTPVRDTTFLLASGFPRFVGGKNEVDCEWWLQCFGWCRFMNDDGMGPETFLEIEGIYFRLE